MANCGHPDCVGEREFGPAPSPPEDEAELTKVALRPVDEAEDEWHPAPSPDGERPGYGDLATPENGSEKNAITGPDGERAAIDALHRYLAPHEPGLRHDYEDGVCVPCRVLWRKGIVQRVLPAAGFGDVTALRQRITALERYTDARLAEARQEAERAQKRATALDESYDTLMADHAKTVTEAARLGSLVSTLRVLHREIPPYKDEGSCCAQCDGKWPCPTVEAVRRAFQPSDAGVAT